MFIVKMEKQKYFIVLAMIQVLFAWLILIHEFLAASRHRFRIPLAQQMLTRE